MALTKHEQAQALTCLLKEDYEAYGRLIEDANSISRADKIDLLFRALALAGLRVSVSSSDEQVQRARDDLATTITNATADAQVVAIRRERAE